MLVVEFAIVAGLIVLNGLLATSEFPLVSANRPILEQMSRTDRAAPAAPST